jgi:hypothetical protein
MAGLAALILCSGLAQGGVELQPAPGLDIELVPAIPVEERLAPGRAELEYVHLGEDDSTWVTERLDIGVLTRFWGDAMRDITSLDPLPAPGPVTRDQALGFLPGATGIDGSVLFMTDEHCFTYEFDSLGRAVEIDWDPVADSGAYRFRYWYCPSESPPVWVD